ncbi:MAG: Four helix bundle sensory module for signal transduction, partial [Deltaproteobacteria bacterium]|nr:Four helix bundle sensory module for signal transduction [Deltaproteobacteria bacterium]
MKLNVISMLKLTGRFSNLTIRKRLATGFGIVLALMIILTVTGVWSLKVINGKIEQITQVNNAKIEFAYTIQNSISAIDKSVLTIVMVADPSTTT